MHPEAMELFSDETVIEIDVVGNKHRIIRSFPYLRGNILKRGGRLDHLVGDTGNGRDATRDQNTRIHQGLIGIDDLSIFDLNDRDLCHLVLLGTSTGGFNIDDREFHALKIMLAIPPHSFHLQYAHHKSTEPSLDIQHLYPFKPNL